MANGGNGDKTGGPGPARVLQRQHAQSPAGAGLYEGGIFHPPELVQGFVEHNGIVHLHRPIRWIGRLFGLDPTARDVGDKRNLRLVELNLL